MKQIITLFLTTMTIMTLLSCKRDIESKTPAEHLAHSETLVVPAAVALPANAAGHTRVVTLYAEGVQKYRSEVVPGSIPTTYIWIFTGPEARLYNASNQLVGSHSGGPSWKLLSGDSIYAQHFTPQRTARVDPTAVDWLLLQCSVGKAPSGIFSEVSYIQRIATTGGVYPAYKPKGANETTEVPYTAVYRFTRKNP